MKERITFGGVSAEPGTKNTGMVPVLDTGLSFPVTVINGKEEGRTVLITSAIHGCEYPSIEAVFELAEEILDPGIIRGQVVVINPVNVEAFINRRPYIVPSDGKNLNRLFPPDPEGTDGDKMAYVLTEEFLKKVDFHIDTHGGDIPEIQPSYVYYPGISDHPDALRISEEAARYILHARYMIKSKATNHAYTHSAILGVPSLELELGECTRWSRPEVDRYLENVLNVLKYLEVFPGQAVKRPEETGITTITDGVYLDADYSGRWYPLVGRDDKIEKGQKIGYIKDLFGNVLVEYFAEYDAEILMVVATLGIKKGDPIIAYGRS